MKSGKWWWPLLGCLLVLPWAVQQWRAHGLPMYATDDAYIHLSIAKHALRDHVWGVSPGEYAPASSSLLWTSLLIAIGAVAGVSPWIPFVLNAALLLGMAIWFCRQSEFPAWAGWGLVAAVPSAYFVITGMECLLQAAIDLALVVAVFRLLRTGKGHPLQLAIVSFLAGAVRYEGVLLVAALSVIIFFTTKGRKIPLQCLAASLVAPLVFAVVSSMHGGPLVPTSVMVKAGGDLGFAGRIWQALHAIYEVGLAPWIAATVFVLIASQASAPPLRVLIRAVSVVFLLQVLLGACSWRYCAWFLPIMLLFLTWIWEEQGKSGPSHCRKGALGGALALTLLPSLFLLRTGIQATVNYRTLHLPIAELIEAQPRGTTIGLYDIGLATFVGDQPIIDFAGLATVEVAKAKIEHRFDTAVMRTVASRRNLKVAILFPNQFEGSQSPPAEWIKVAEWSILGNVVALDNRVDIYATDADEAAKLRTQLTERTPSLPKGLEQVLTPP